MKRLWSLSLVAFILCGLASWTRAGDDKNATAVVDKAIKALGGEKNLSAIKAASWKGKGKISFGGNESNFAQEVTFQGFDHIRQEFEGEFNGEKVKGVTILAGDKGWRKFAGNDLEIDKDGIATEKRNVYLQVIPVTLVGLKDKGFKLESAPDEKVGDKPAAVIKVTPPGGGDYKLYFDKDSGLPVKQVAKVTGFGGMEFTQETSYGNYKDFKGVKKATSIENRRDGEKFMEMQITEFTVLDKVDPKLFAKPE